MANQIFCVPGLLQADEVGPITGWHTVEKRSTSVHSATCHSSKLINWKAFFSLTLGRNCRGAHSATIQPADRVSNLRQHVLQHSGKKPHRCEQCDFSSIHSNNMKQHKRTHSGERPHRCTTCEFSSIKTDNLKRKRKQHMMRKHTGEKPHKCNQCKYKCIIASDLQSHIRTHTGEKPFSCNHCRKSFK